MKKPRQSKRQVTKKQQSKKRRPGKKGGSGRAAAPIPSMQEMERLLSVFDSEDEEDEELLPLDQAQEIMYDAWEAPTRKEAVAMARKALSISRDCADAYCLLAEETAATLDDMIDLYRRGVEAGERAIGRETFEKDAGFFWGILKTRPYMRARAGLAQALWAAGKREEAVEHYRELLRLNPNDNQGIRDLLMPCLIELDQDEEAEQLFREYQDDHMAVWLYSRALLDFRKLGDSAEAEKSLRAALGQNRHVPRYLLGRRKIPAALPPYYGSGDENEAVLYASRNQAAWEKTHGALKWLAARAT